MNPFSFRLIFGGSHQMLIDSIQPPLSVKQTAALLAAVYLPAAFHPCQAFAGTVFIILLQITTLAGGYK